MVGQQIFSLLLIVIAIMMIGLATVTWRNRPGRWGPSFVAILLGLTLRVLGYAFLINSSDPDTQRFWVVIEVLGVLAAVPSIFTFVFAYIGRPDWLRLPKLLLIVAVPSGTLLAGILEPTLLFQAIMVNSDAVFPDVTFEPGLALVIFAIWSYVGIVGAIILLIREASRSRGLRRQQTVILICSPIIMGVASFLSFFELTAVDWLPISAGLTIGIMGFGALRLHMLGFIRLAQHTLMDSLDSSVVVVDGRGYIVDMNPAGYQLFNLSPHQIIGHAYTTIQPQFAQLMPPVLAPTPQTPIHYQTPNQQTYYERQLSELTGDRFNGQGYVLIWHDVTAHIEQENQLTAQKQLFEDLLTVAKTTSEGLTLRTTFQNILQIAIQLARAEDSSLILLDGDGEPTYSLFAHEDTMQQKPTGFVSQVVKQGLANWVINNQQSAVIGDTRQDERWVVDESSPIDERSALAVPILYESDVLGILTVTHSSIDHFSQADVELLEAAAAHMALALHNAQLYEEQRQEARRRNTLYQMLRAIVEHLDPDTVAQKAVETVTMFTGWTTITVLTPIKDTTELAIMATNSLSIFVNAENLNRLETISRDTIDLGEPQLIKYTEETNPDESNVSNSLFEMMAIPLKRQERVTGVLFVAGHESKPLDKDDFYLAESIADAIALALENAELYASTDKQLQEQTALYRASTAISFTLDLPILLQTVAEEMCGALDATSAYIASYDSNTYMSTILAEYIGNEANEHERVSDLGETYHLPHIFPDDAGYLDRKQPKMSHIDDPSLPETEREHMVTYGAKSTLVIPLHVGGRTVAYAEVWESRQTRVFTSDEIALAEAIAQQVAVAMENARLYQSVVDERGRLDAVIQTSQDGIFLVSMDGRILVTNERAVEYLQLSGKQSDWQGKHLQDVFLALRHHAKVALGIILQEVRRAQGVETSSGEGNCEIPPRSIDWLNLPVVVEGNTIGWVVVLRDATEARLLARMREDITRTMIHDLRNPLTVIHAAEGFLSEKWSETLDGQAQRFLNVINQNVGKGLSLVNSILDISRLENRQMPLEPTLFLMSDMIDAVIHRQLPLAEEKGIKLEHVAESFIPPVWADLGLIERVIHNLLDNALKFSPAGSLIQFHLDVDYSTNRERVLVSIRDKGPGIPAEIQGQLFQQFTTGSQLERGSGLGLAFCRMALQAHGEDIWVEDTGSEGTTITFSLAVVPDLV